MERSSELALIFFTGGVNRRCNDFYHILGHRINVGWVDFWKYSAREAPFSGQAR